MNSKSKLILLRGQAGSGKSSVAKALQEQAKTPLVVLEQDHYRKEPLQTLTNSKDRKELIFKMLESNALVALDYGYNVLIEGIFSSMEYKQMFAELFSKHPNNNFSFYFDTSFEETVRRHLTRNKTQEFGEAEMRDWYTKTESYGHAFEKQIPESNTLKQSIEMILKETSI